MDASRARAFPRREVVGNVRQERIAGSGWQGTWALALSQAKQAPPGIHRCTSVYVHLRLRSVHRYHNVALVIHKTSAVWAGVGRNDQRLLGGSGECSGHTRLSTQVKLQCGGDVSLSLYPPVAGGRRRDRQPLGIWRRCHRAPDSRPAPTPLLCDGNDVVQRHFGLFGRRPGHHSDSIQKWQCGFARRLGLAGARLTCGELRVCHMQPSTHPPDSSSCGQMRNTAETVLTWL